MVLIIEDNNEVVDDKKLKGGSLGGVLYRLFFIKRIYIFELNFA